MGEVFGGHTQCVQATECSTQNCRISHKQPRGECQRPCTHSRLSQFLGGEDAKCHVGKMPDHCRTGFLNLAVGHFHAGAPAGLAAKLVFVRLAYHRRFVGAVVFVHFLFVIFFVFVRISGRHCDREGTPVGQPSQKFL